MTHKDTEVAHQPQIALRDLKLSSHAVLRLLVSGALLGSLYFLQRTTNPHTGETVETPTAKSLSMSKKEIETYAEYLQYIQAASLASETE